MTTGQMTRWDAVSWLSLFSYTAVGGLRKSHGREVLSVRETALLPLPLPCRTSTATSRSRFASFSPGQQVPVCPQGIPASGLGCRGSTMRSSNLSCSVNPCTTGSWVLILFISHRTYRGTDDSSVTHFVMCSLRARIGTSQT